MRFIKRLVQKWVVNRVLFGGIVPVGRWEDRSSENKKEYLQEAKELARNKTLANEINRLIDIASRTIVRKTKVNEDVAWHRGGIHYLEALRKRIEFLRDLDK